MPFSRMRGDDVAGIFGTEGLLHNPGGVRQSGLGLGSQVRLWPGGTCLGASCSDL